jgi:hypothetical protein
MLVCKPRGLYKPNLSDLSDWQASPKASGFLNPVIVWGVTMATVNETVELVLQRIQQHRSLYEGNEMAVRQHIVNPLLRSLGWDPENPQEVRPNVFTEEGFPDYELIKDGGRVLFIEAKKLSVDVNQKDVIRRLATYCSGEGVNYGVLTNGAVWLLVRGFEEGKSALQRVLWLTNIERDEQTASVRKLGTISKENIGHVDSLVRKVQILDEVWQSALDDPESMIGGLIPVFEGIIKGRHPEYEFEPSEIGDFLREKITQLIRPVEAAEPAPLLEESLGQERPPSTMRIGDESHQIRTFREILLNTAEWLIKRGKLTKRDCPVSILQRGGRRYLIDTQPKHSDGKPFTVPARLSNGLYMEAHCNRAMFVDYARRLLVKFDYSADTLQLP